jgi:tetratricopeptide (TPR) repeat protein
MCNGRALCLCFAIIAAPLGGAIAGASHAHVADPPAEVNQGLRTDVQLCEKGDALLKEGRDSEAERAYLDALGVSPDLSCAHLNLGKLYNSQKRWDESMTSFETVLRKDPGNIAAQQAMSEAATAAALAARKNGDMDSALQYLLRAQSVTPQDSALLKNLGIQELDMHLYRDAEQTLLRARAIDSSDAVILYALARAQLEQQKVTDAEANLRAYIQLRPDDATAFYGLGHLLHMELKDDEARAALEHSIALKPMQTESYYELGQMALDQGQNDSASSWFQKVLSRNQNHGGALTGLGVIEYRQKHYVAAEQFLVKAVASSPDYRAARYYYGMTLLRLGKKEQAASELAVAEKLSRQENTTERSGMQLASPK